MGRINRGLGDGCRVLRAVALWAMVAVPTLEAQNLFEPSTADSNISKLSADFAAAAASNQELIEAVRLTEQGQLEQAHAKAAAFVAGNPGSASGYEVLGMVLALQGKLDEGQTHLERAVQLSPAQYTAISKIGDILMAKGDNAGAKARFQQAVAMNPLDRLPYQRLGLIFEQEADYPQAIENFERGIQGTAPDYLGIKVNLGRCYNLTRQFNRTITLLGPVVPVDSRNPLAHLVLGTARLALRETQPALTHFERARALETNPDAVRIALGVAYRQAGQFNQSREELEAALKSRPDWSLAKLQLGETLVASGRPAEAERYLQEAAAADPASRTGIRNRLAEVLLMQKKSDEALKVYESLRADGTADVRTYDALATLLQATDRLPQAEQMLLEAEKKFPGNVQVQYRLGLHHALVRNYDRALAALQKARQSAPADPRIVKAVSLTELRRGNRDGAIAEARAVLALVPDRAEDEFYLASLLDEAGQAGEAAEFYDKVLRKVPTHVGALNNLAQVRLKQKQTRVALELAQRAVQLAPEHPSILDTLGWIQLEAGDAEAAARTLEKAVAGEAPSAVHLYHLAVVYDRLGRREAALERLTTVLNSAAVFPERPAAEQLAARLRGGARP